jgi:lipopolysaccharide export system protein LptC
MIQRLFILALLIVAAAGSAWLLQRLSSNADRRTAIQYHEPDYYLEH